MSTNDELRHTAESVQRLFKQYVYAVKARLRRTSKATRLAAVLVLLFTFSGGGVGFKRWLDKRKKDRIQGQRLLRRNSGLRGKDGARILVVPYRNATAKVKIHGTKSTTFDAHRRLFLAPPKSTGLDELQASSALGGTPALSKPGLNLAFLHQYLSLTSIMIPRWNSKESALLISQSMFLALRTWLSLVVARLDGEIVRDLVAGHGRAFLWGIIKWCGIGGLASYTNAAIKFLQSKLSIAFRTRLTRYIHDLYMNDNLNYYKLSNLDGGVGQTADQFITQDLTLFCDSAASLFSSVGKPFVDMCVFNYQLFHSLGPLAFTGLFTTYIFTATLLRKLAPPFGKLKAVEGRREGEFRSLHSRLIVNAEEVAFYGGADIEQVFLNRSFKELRTWIEGIYRLKIRYNMLEDFILKYSWSAFGYLVSALPIFLPAWGGLGGALELGAAVDSQPRERSRMKEFITNKRLMLSLADAGGRIMYSIKDLSELAGYTSRIFTLLSTLHRVHANAYLPPRGTHPELFSLSDIQGTAQKGYDGIRLEDVPLVAPASFPRPGDELLEALSFSVHSGEHLLISGSNGVGKTAIARLVAGLWPLYRGLVSRPRRVGVDGIMFLPQRPYLSTGTLRDQVIYPHSELEMRESGRSERELRQILEDARLRYLPDREGGWDSRKDWKNVLSGGEKQRMQFARLFYHEPRYAFLDEATSAVSQDVEGLLYERAKARGVTLLTISTRASLKKYHSFVLELGTGEDGFGWVFERIGTERERVGVEREIRELKDRLEQVDGLRKRLGEIEGELGKVWVKGESNGQEDWEVNEIELTAPGYLAEEREART